MPKTRTSVASGSQDSSSSSAAAMEPLEHVLANALVADASSHYLLGFQAAGIQDIDDLRSLSPPETSRISHGVMALWSLLLSNWLRPIPSSPILNGMETQGTTDVDVFLCLHKAGLSDFRRELVSTAPITSSSGPTLPTTISKPIESSSLSAYPLCPLLMNSSRESTGMSMIFQPLRTGSNGTSGTALLRPLLPAKAWPMS